MTDHANESQRDTNRRLTAVQAAITGRLFCASCQRLSPVESGRNRPIGTGHRRFTCASCIKRIGERVAGSERV